MMASSTQIGRHAADPERGLPRHIRGGALHSDRASVGSRPQDFFRDGWTRPTSRSRPWRWRRRRNNSARLRLARLAAPAAWAGDPARAAAAGGGRGPQPAGPGQPAGAGHPGAASSTGWWAGWRSATASPRTGEHRRRDAHAVRAALAGEPAGHDRPGPGGLGLGRSIYHVSFVLVAAFLLLDILIGAVIDPQSKAREMEFVRTQPDRRAVAATTEGGERRRGRRAAAARARLRTHAGESWSDRRARWSDRRVRPFCQVVRRSLRPIGHGSGISLRPAPPGHVTADGDADASMAWWSRTRPPPAWSPNVRARPRRR